MQISDYEIRNTQVVDGNGDGDGDEEDVREQKPSQQATHEPP